MADLFAEQVEQSFSQESAPVQSLDTFSFEEKANSALISLGNLRQTREILKNHKGRLPESRPLEHVQFLDQLCDMLTSKNISFSEPEIYVAKSDSHYESRIAAAYGKPNILGAWLFERLVARFQFNSLSSEDYNPSVAIGYNVRGIALAFGLNVRMCQNMNIFGDQFMKTYDDGLPFNRLMELFKAWLDSFEERHENNLSILQRMKSTFLGNTKDELQKMVGLLHLNATAKNMNQKVIAPLNQTQVNDFSKQIITMIDTGKIDVESENVINIDDLYQIGTNILTHSQTNLEYKWDRVNDLGNFFEKHYLN